MVDLFPQGGCMRSKTILLASSFVLGCVLAISLRADAQIVPPTVSRIWPAGMERGSTATFTLEGRNLEGATEVIFGATGMSAKVTGIKDIPEQITGPRAGQDLEAQVPRGKKQTAEI